VGVGVLGQAGPKMQPKIKFRAFATFFKRGTKMTKTVTNIL